MSERPPRTALVHDWLTGQRGGEHVLEAIAARFPEAPIFTLFHHPGAVSPALERHPIRTSFLQHLPGARRHYRRYLPLFPAAIEDFDLAGYDLVVSTSHCVAKGAIPGPTAYHLCYCHTPMRYAWDAEHLYFPRRRGVVARLRGLALGALRTWDVASAPRVDRFVANSAWVASRIRRYYRRDAAVLHPPVDTEFFTPGEGEPGRYLLAVAALVPYKRLDVAVAACTRLGVELRIVGSGPEKRRLARLTGAGTRLLGTVDAARLRALYRGALALVQPGVEDFGIASVEAQACGVPVVAADRGGIREIVTHGVHGLLYDAEAGAEGMTSAIDKLPTFRSNPLELRRNAERFSAARFRHGFDRLLAERTALREVAAP